MGIKLRTPAGGSLELTVTNLGTDEVLTLEPVIDRPTKESPTSIKVNGNVLTIPSPVAGTDYYFSLHAITDTKQPDTIGGFHYGLVASGEAPTGNKTEADMVKLRGINAYSIWTKWFRPVSNPEGMVYILGKWYDIYLLNSEHIANGTSKAGLTIAGGGTDHGRAIPKIPLEYGGDGSINYGAFKWFHATEIGISHSKQLISYEEFMGIAYGVVEGTDSSTVGETVVGAVEHYPELMSKFGIEQATGTQYIWGADVGGNRDEGSITWDWRDKLDGRGQIYSLHDNHITAVRLGGNRGNGVNAGSRCSDWNVCVWHSGWNIGCRFASDHRQNGGM